MESSESNPLSIPDRKLSIPCSCAGSCQILVVAEFWDTGEGEGDRTYLDFYTSHRQDRFGHRFKVAWRSLKGQPYYHAIVLEPSQVRDLAEFLNPTAI